MKKIMNKVVIASSYDNHYLVIVNGLIIARVKNYDDLVNRKISEMRHEQLEQWVKLSSKDKSVLKSLLGGKNDNNLQNK